MARRPTRSRSSAPKSGTERALAYCEDVCAGVLPACEFTRLACERQLKDLARKRWRYRFDEELANDTVEFIEALPHVKGRQFVGDTLILSGWQCFIITTVFGWVDKQGLRRFRTVYIEVPRKNGKSTMTAPVGLFMLAADGEPGAEVYSAATVRDQAKIVWGDARQMVLRTPMLRSALDVQTSVHSIYVPSSNSTFKPLSRDQQGNLDGLNVHCALVDELHGHKDRGVWDVLETGTGSRSQPLLWAITTAGSNRAGICYEQRTYASKILHGRHKDETYFGVIYTIDKDDDPLDPASWAKANPNLGISVSEEDLARKAVKARQMAAAMNTFLTKHLNVWVNADAPWMNMTAWDACADPSLSIEDFVGEDVILACDLATKTDIAAKTKLFKRVIDDVTHYYAFGDYYVPEETLEDEANAHYAGWEREGHILATPGNVIDFATIENSVREDCVNYHVIEALFDPWQAAHMIQNLEADGLNAAEYRQTVPNMSLPMKELEALVLAGRFHHDGNPALAWMISNVVCHTDAKDNIYPRKEQPKNKIDGAVSLIMALGGAIMCDDDDGDFSDFLAGPVSL